MADTTQAPINGTYPTQPNYPESFNHTHTAVNSAANFQPAQSTTPSNAPVGEPKNNGISKDEVGWYFVEQYYTNMSRSPDKLHLFYSRRSQLVFGTEAESVQVAVGQKAINEKIKQLDFQDCKVRVLNVDSQASFDNILVSVIGEISNKHEPSRKFIQTFVLAEQPNGYYVLNDIFRYLADEEEVANEDTAPAEEPEPEAPVAPVEATPRAAESQVDTEVAAEKVDEKLEETLEETSAESAPAQAALQPNGTEPKDTVTPEVAEAEAEAEALEEDKPASPETTPAEPAQKEASAPTKETAPPARALPKTWANIASKSGAAAPVVPAIPVKQPTANPAPAPAAAPAAVAAAAAAATNTTPQPAAAPAAPAPAPAPESTSSQPPSNDGSGWQTAGHDHKKTQSRVGEDQNVLGYIKNVTEKVDANLLKQTLSRFGKLKHFDVSRQKNCAFVEFADHAGYLAAVTANPHQIGSEQINVEERRPRANAYGNSNYGPGRGGAGRGRGERPGSQGRGGFQRDGRGGFAPRGRGGNVNSKGRNQTQTA